MSLFRRTNKKGAVSKVWWFRFKCDGRRIDRSAKTTNRRLANRKEAAYRLKIESKYAGFKERKRPGTFADFKDAFMAEVQKTSKPRTIKFWRGRLLEAIDRHPSLDVTSMGFPKEWRKLAPWV